MPPTPRRPTPASLAAGWQGLIGPITTVNIVLFVYVLFQPLLITRVAYILTNEITLIQVAHDLYGVDILLFLVVAVFGILAPSFKMLAALYVWYFADVRRGEAYGKWLALLGKLSMLDIMLLAILIVAIKGIGVGSVEIRPGLYAYVVLIVLSFLTSLAVEHLLARFCRSTQPEPAALQEVSS